MERTEECFHKIKNSVLSVSSVVVNLSFEPTHSLRQPAHLQQFLGRATQLAQRSQAQGIVTLGQSHP